MPRRSSSLRARLAPFVILVAACGGGDAVAPPGATPPGPALPSRPLASPVSSAAATAPASIEPTTLTEAQKQRDATMAPLATAIVDAYANWDGFFSSLVANYSRDGERILFGSTRDGLPEVYLGDVAHPGDPPKAVTTGPERAIWASFTRDGKAILFLRDQKGDENHAIWRVSADGRSLTNLTPKGSLHRGEPLLPSGKPRMMTYSASSTASPQTLYFVQDVDGGEPKLVYTHPHPSGAADVTPDGARVLFFEYRSPDDLVALELELATGSTRRVYPPEGTKSGLYGASYSADGRRLFVSTDEGGESSVLLALDAKTGKELARYVNDSPRTAPMGVLASPKGDRVAIVVDAGNHGEIRVLDAKTLRLERAVKVPLGEVHLGAFRDDGKAFSILISLPTQPPDVFSVDTAMGEVKPLRADRRPALASLPPIDASIETVKAFDGLTIPINRYLPVARAGGGASDGSKKLPTIAIFHGGPATSYAVRWSPYARFFVSLGYAVIEPNVRGSSGFGRAYEMADNREKRADWLKDLETVNAWAKSQPWCDPDRVVVWGQSYGGYTTLMAVTRQPKLWRAGVDLYGVADLKAFLRTTDAAIRDGFVPEFGDVEKDSALLDEFSPMRDVDKIAAPLFVYAGQNDPRVPRSESDAIVRALRTRGVPVEYMVAANEGHTVDRRETKVELMTRAARFLEEGMK